MAEPAKPQSPGHHQSFWLWVMCLTGVDYFSTLGYQPSIAFNATGLLAPLATGVLVAITLFAALPVYAHVAGQSHQGQGSIAMLERLVRGWTGKFIVLVLLGFAATDFVITKTLSAADAAEHLNHNPYLEHTLSFHHSQVLVTMILLVVLGVIFLRGFREVIGLAVVIVAVYLVLNVIIIGGGLYYLFTHPHHLTHWYHQVTHGEWHFADRPLLGLGHDWLAIVAVCLLLFPKLALGLSGFETGVAVMPLVRGKPGDDPARPAGRIRNTRKLLLTAALIMSVLLLGSALVTATLIPAKALEVVKDDSGRMIHEQSGKAANRALAYLAHGEKHYLAEGETTDVISPVLGHTFGTIYDIATVVILWFAGASAMAGLLNLVPQYLPRYGMAPEWARAVRPLVVLFMIINIGVTWIFQADVEAQSGAYATGVLVLISSASVASLIDYWRKPRATWSARTGRFLGVSGFGLITVIFLYTTVAIIVEKPAGIAIAACFIGAIVVVSMVSRTRRSTELRFEGFEFADPSSRLLWDAMRDMHLPVLVPHRPGRRKLAEKEESIRREHHLGPDVHIVFIEAELGDVSEFLQHPLMEVKQEEGRFALRITRCASVAHVIAAVALELSKVGPPPEIHFGWSDESPVIANRGFGLFGEGNVPWMVRELIRRAEPNPERQPRVVIG